MYMYIAMPFSAKHFASVFLRSKTQSCEKHKIYAPQKFGSIQVLSFSSAGLTHTDLAAEGASPSKADYRTNFEQLVTSFGSEKAKRVHAAHERNKVESSALEGALATAVTHVQTEVEKAGGG